MRISPATSDDIPAATGCMVSAFASDPVMEALFADSPLGRTAAAAQFFGLLLEARVALNMPVLVARADQSVVGIAKGDDTARPDWPVPLAQRMNAIETAHPPLPARFQAYDRVAEAAELSMPHYYLGVLAVSPAAQGKGIGKALIGAFLDLSDADPGSKGTALETGTPANLGLYAHFGFSTRSTGPVEQATLWCMFRPKPATVAS